jgi:hypothetical protein|tara:strand:- start:773 stop:952 length:180 start_codon:yes stop_codon:yes gene_type:complete
MQQNSEVDVNVLVKIYHQKLANALNQNVLLEAKLETLKQDYEEKINNLLQETSNIEDKE